MYVVKECLNSEILQTKWHSYSSKYCYHLFHGNIAVNHAEVQTGVVSFFGCKNFSCECDRLVIVRYILELFKSRLETFWTTFTGCLIWNMNESSLSIYVFEKKWCYMTILITCVYTVIYGLLFNQHHRHGVRRHPVFRPF